MSIHVDPKFGHVRVLDDEGREVAQIVDFGAICSIHDGARLTPAEAIDVGRALIKWGGNVRTRRQGGAS